MAKIKIVKPTAGTSSATTRVPLPKTASQLKSVTPSGKPEQSYFEQVYAIVRQVPRGRVTTYGAIAACLGTKLSARMVGWAMNHSHSGKNVPAHRVVNRNGMLSGKQHFADSNEMQRLLEKEKIKVKNDKIVDFQKHFWDPATEML